MLGFFDLIGGSKIIGLMADELGIEKRLFKTALTEQGVNFAHFKIEHKIRRKLFPNEDEAAIIASLALESIR
jgi:hypothetical protein